MTDPVDFVIKQLAYDLSGHGGLALVGRLLKRINLNAMIDLRYPVRGCIANSDVLKCYLGLLTLGKNDFEAVEGFRTERFVHQELDLRAGSQHSASESEYNIERALATACAVAKAPLLLRADSGFCSQHLIKRTLEQAARLQPFVHAFGKRRRESMSL